MSKHPRNLPVVTVTVSSGWPESDLVWRGHVYRYQDGLRWEKDPKWIPCPYCDGVRYEPAPAVTECGFCYNGTHEVGT